MKKDFLNRYCEEQCDEAIFHDFYGLLRRSKVLLAMTITLILFLTAPAFCAENQKLYLRAGNSYLLEFNEKVEDYTVNNQNSLKVEPLNSIFTDRQTILIKPLNQTDTTLTVKTGAGLYSFDVLINKINPQSGTITAVESLSIDTPPEYDKTNDFIIDKPPMLPVLNNKGSM